MQRVGIVWFRNDLRLHDNEALSEAIQVCDQILPVFIFDSTYLENRTPYGFHQIGSHRFDFLRQSVIDLREHLQSLGANLGIYHGITSDILYELAKEYKADWVFCNRERTPIEQGLQDAVEEKLWSLGRELRYSRGKMLLYTADLPFPVSHTPNSYFTYKKEVSYIPIRQCLPIPDSIPIPNHWDAPYDLPERPEDDLKTEKRYSGGERYIYQHLDNNLANQAALSPWLANGSLSVKHVFHRLNCSTDIAQETRDQIIEALYVRDHLRFMVKKYGPCIFRSSGIHNSANAIDYDQEAITHFLNGKTGEEIIDAAIYKLYRTGYLSSAYRRLLANYFVHHMHQDWYIGAQWFQWLLIDYDPCSCYMNWMNCAGCGTDERLFSPMNMANQARLLDPDGTFRQRWLTAEYS